MTELVGKDAATAIINIFRMFKKVEQSVRIRDMEEC